MTDEEALRSVWNEIDSLKRKAALYRRPGGEFRRDGSRRNVERWERLAEHCDQRAEALLRVLELAQRR